MTEATHVAFRSQRRAWSWNLAAYSPGTEVPQIWRYRCFLVL
jgi:hypothetical protein